MVYDCIIIGGGPAGLNAALVLGRAKLNVLLLDNENPRNKVTGHSHGFITNDHLSPKEIREKGFRDLLRYPNISKVTDRVMEIIPDENFLVITEKNQYEANRILIASGMNEKIPDVDGLMKLYGKRFFNCPFCDGWEMKDKKLAIIVENEDVILHFVMMISHWSDSIHLFTNGLILDDSIKYKLDKNNITYNEQPILKVDCKNEMIKICLSNNEEVIVEGGFVAPVLKPNLQFANLLNIDINERGRIQVDDFGKTSHPKVYAAGDNISSFGEQLVFSASSGSKVATGIVKEIALDKFV
ncbi:NAD(P)/FAD-dependent oxidoreductase [Enterococcus faecium]|uniref:NAD(P)/FAD-dependent oxidoreductase n=1 Tax=Enterococcus faecium TaxID=1352 RepID=UPI000CF1017D|nr:NAD(P)/FAD-dependent oxidoreductase [Enterococcus faecium]EGP4724689.1 NAD(P)/FAD-dependent oxidoreductase [Enterococcus faecium]NTK57755.1 NAD(P)/FAD-dependent oxidoreductase [Enterococcus faecium]PQC34429.1 NAD(P)/FAD-dependent oxidoreductase [Enterococcus faecium]